MRCACPLVDARRYQRLLTPAAARVEQTSTERHHATRIIESTLPGIVPPAVRKGSRLWPLPRWLERVALPLVRRRKGRRAVFAFFGVAMLPVLAALAFAEPETKPRGRVQDSHPLRWPRVTWERAFGFSAHEQAVTATLLWGADGVDRSGGWGQVDLLRNSTNVGRVRWREGFGFDARTQAHLAAVCDALREQPWLQRDPERSFWRGRGKARSPRRRTPAPTPPSPSASP